MLYNCMHAAVFIQSNYEEWGVKSILIGGIVGMSTAFGLYYNSKEKIIKEKDKAFASLLKEKEAAFQKSLEEKDAKIMAVINDHQKDLKEANNDMKQVIEKYHQFTDNLKDIVNARGV